MKDISDSIHSAILALQEEYPNAIPVFGGALFAHSLAIVNFGRFVSLAFETARYGEFHKWHESPADTIRRFCHLCYVDPALIEVYIGKTIEEALS